jgi:hypothetical protein
MNLLHLSPYDFHIPSQCLALGMSKAENANYEKIMVAVREVYDVVNRKSMEKGYLSISEEVSTDFTVAEKDAFFRVVEAVNAVCRCYGKSHSELVNSQSCNTIMKSVTERLRISLLSTWPVWVDVTVYVLDAIYRHTNLFARNYIRRSHFMKTLRMVAKRRLNCRSALWQEVGCNIVLVVTAWSGIKPGSSMNTSPVARDKVTVAQSPLASPMRVPPNSPVLSPEMSLKASVPEECRQEQVTVPQRSSPKSPPKSPMLKDIANLPTPDKSLAKAAASLLEDDSDNEETDKETSLSTAGTELASARVHEETTLSTARTDQESAEVLEQRSYDNEDSENVCPNSRNNGVELEKSASQCDGSKGDNVCGFPMRDSNTPPLKNAGGLKPTDELKRYESKDDDTWAFAAENGDQPAALPQTEKKPRVKSTRKLVSSDKNVEFKFYGGQRIAVRKNPV